MNLLRRSLLLRSLLVLGGSLWMAVAAAQMNIDITTTGKQMPVAVAGFANESALPQSVTGVVRNDLANSGYFRMVDTGNNTPSEPQQVNFGEWKTRGADALVIGSVAALAGGKYEIRFRLYDVAKQNQLAAFSDVVTASQLRETGHKIADVVYEKLLGYPGVFSTRIAYVYKQAGVYELRVADADGSNPQTVLRSAEPIISPAWSPDGGMLAYVSFEAKKPVVYVQTLLTGARRAVANFKGNNSAPAWAPDGRRLAISLSKDGVSQLYTINLDGSNLQRLTNSAAIDTEATWSPDGQQIYFTSDRGGSPQIYRVPAAGGPVERVTISGSYNVSAALSPDGKTMTYLQRDAGYRVAVMDLSNRQVQLLSDGPNDESPSFAPNGRMILYTAKSRGRASLAVVSADGLVKQKLTELTGEIYEPAWGPFPRY